MKWSSTEQHSNVILFILKLIDFSLAANSCFLLMVPSPGSLYSVFCVLDNVLDQMH